MDEYQSGWRYRPIFPSNVTLKVIIYVYTSGIQTDKYCRAGFDNIKVEIPGYGKLSPFLPIIEGPLNPKLGIQQDYTFSAIDSDGDDLYIYIEWGDDSVGKWIGPIVSGKKEILSHTWYNRAVYTLLFNMPIRIHTHGKETFESFN